MNGDEARPEAAELADPLGRPPPAAGFPSSKASTSLRSSSNIDSSDILVVVGGFAVEVLRLCLPMIFFDSQER